MDAMINEFRSFHNIQSEINLPFKDDNGLYVLYNDNWIRLSKQNNSFYAKSTLKKHGVDFLRAVGLEQPRSSRYQTPSMNDLRAEMMQEYIIDTPVPQTGGAPLRPLRRALTTQTLEFKQTPFTIGNYLKGYEMNMPLDHALENDPRIFFDEVKSKIQLILNKELEELGGVKYQLGLRVLMSKETPDGTITYDTPTFYHSQIPITNQGEINLNEAVESILSKIDTWQKNGSNWVIERIETLWINIANYQPLRGGSYIDLPKKLKSKHAIINVQNDDDDCLRWSLKSALYPVSVNANRTSQYPVNDGLNFEGIDSPTPISQIKKVEKQNNLAINVFGWKKSVIIYQISKQPSEIPRINLMLVEETTEDGVRTHYTWIKDLNRLLYDQTRYKGRKYFCERCLHGYTREDLLEQHKPYCNGNGERAIRIEMPKPERSILQFKNWHRQMKVPFVIYADFESIINKIEGPSLDPTKSNTQRTQIHEACGFCYVVVRSDGDVGQPVLYRGPNAAQIFLQCLGQTEDEIKEFCSNPQKIIMEPEDWRVYNETTHCYICHELMTMKKAKNGRDYLDKVRDHCHLTGKFRGAAHFLCNLKLKLDPEKIIIPVVFHNLKGYDAHLIMQAISKTEGDIKCIPSNMEKYISFSLRQLRFIDSAQFLLASLDKLVSANKPEDFRITKRFESKTDLLVRKGIYPYEYMDNWDRFEETNLPSIDKFYSSLTDESISQEDYEHAQNVWQTFGCQNLGDYHDLYLRTDVLLLADVFENFRTTCLNQYELDPAHYYTSPGLSWDALLKKTGVQLELLTDYDMHLFIEKGLRGGISMVSNRYAKANNPLIPDFNPNYPNNYIMYLDANNLYGWAMSQPLPTGNFRWASADEDTIRNLPADSPTGCILEVDLEYPAELHDMHNDYPLAPESLEVQDEWLSPYQKQLLGDKLTKIKKLVPNLMNKTTYVVHYRNLQLYLSLGMRLTKIHRVLAFDQRAWMQPYIRMNTDLRKEAKSDFEKDLYKLMNNSVFGKTMENLRMRVDVKLVRAHEETKLRKLIAKPSFDRQKIFDHDLAALHMFKDKLYLNRPVYVGMSILDLSKLLMYDFFYNKMKRQYGDRVSLLYTDTDSLLMQIQTNDVYKDIAKEIDMYDTSNYPKDHYLYSTTNKKLLGKMKDECEAVPITEYVGLRPKMYSIMTDNNNIRKAKGVKKYVVKKHIVHENYRDALFNQTVFHHGMNMLRSINHQIYGLYVNKLSLSPFDSKRWIMNDGIHTLAFGHYAIYIS